MAENFSLDTLLLQALDGMCVGLIVTTSTGQVKWLNRTAERVLDTRRVDCYRQSLSQVIKDPQLTAFWHEAEACTDTIMGEVSVRWPRHAELKINATTCLDPRGDLVARAILFCDVTRERTAQVQLSRDLADALVDLAGRPSGESRPESGLTAQELRTLRLVGRGMSNQAIAGELDVGVATVRSHLKHVYQKLKLKSRPEAIRFAIENGIT